MGCCGERKDGFISFQRILARSEMPKALSKIQTWIVDSIFYEDNRYSKRASSPRKVTQMNILIDILYLINTRDFLLFTISFFIPNLLENACFIHLGCLVARK